jgi:adenosylmethionine-8-amino-7-oxononanoate aminotransferase
MPAFHKPYLPMLFKVHFAPTPYVYRWPSANGEPVAAEEVLRRSLHAVTDLLYRNRDRVAAICIEPIVQGAGGMIVHPEGFLSGLRDLADEFGVLLICDEVATGFARTGRMFAVEHEEVRPDLMTVAKGITGGYLPLSATLATQQIFDAFLGHPSEGRTFFHGHTYTGNPLACAAALANIDLMYRNEIVPNVQRNAGELAAMLQPLRDLPHVGDIRQKGYMVGIELVKDKATREPFDPALRLGHAVCKRIRSRGVILRPLGDTIVLMPPPAMGLGDLRTIVEAVTAEVAALG